MKLKVFFKLTISLITLFALTVVSHAQEVSATIKICKFSYKSTFSPNMGSSSKKIQEKLYWYKNADKWQSFSENDNDRITINYTGPSKMNLYRKVGQDMSDKSFARIGEINLPSGSREIFVLMISSNSNASFYPVNVSPDKLPKGKLAVMNMTKRTLAVQLNNEKFVPVKRNKNRIFSDVKKEGASPITIAANIKLKDELEIKRNKGKPYRWEYVYRSRIHYPRDQRCIMLIYDTSNNSDRPNLNVNIVQF